MPQYSVIIPAAGASSRFQGFARKKPFVDLKGRAIWLRTVDHFLNRQDVSEIVLVLAANDLEEFKERFRPNLAFMDLEITTGGKSRAESVANGMKALTKPSDFIAVHDAARPMMSSQLIDTVFAAAVQHKAVVPGIPVTSTVKRVSDDGRIVDTVDRSNLRLAQTPQVFARKLLESAFDATDHPELFTDEASLVEAAGSPVFVCQGADTNLKITTAEDFRLAELLLEQDSTTGSPKGLHPFAEDRFLQREFGVE